MPKLSLQEATELLQRCDRHEVHDRRYEDTEYTFIDSASNTKVGMGYRCKGKIQLYLTDGGWFFAREADVLLALGSLKSTFYRDSRD